MGLLQSYLHHMPLPSPHWVTAVWQEGTHKPSWTDHIFCSVHLNLGSRNCKSVFLCDSKFETCRATTFWHMDIETKIN